MGSTLNFIDYWKMIRRRWMLIVSFMIAATFVTGVVSYYWIQPEYEAVATILVQTSSPDNQIIYNDVLANQKLIKTYSDILKSRQIAEDVIGRVGLSVSTDTLLKKIRISSVNDSLVTTITVTDNNPAQAVQIVNAVALSFSKNLSKIMKVDNVSILDQAQMPASPTPSYPKPKQNMMIAGVVGGVIGTLVALLIGWLDKTVKEEDEIENLLGLPVLGVIPAFGGNEKSEKRKRSRKSLSKGVTGGAGE